MSKEAVGGLRKKGPYDVDTFVQDLDHLGIHLV